MQKCLEPVVHWTDTRGQPNILVIKILFAQNLRNKILKRTNISIYFYIFVIVRVAPNYESPQWLTTDWQEDWAAPSLPPGVEEELCFLNTLHPKWSWD